MINLIPNEEKKIKVRDFYFRFFVLLLLTLALSFGVASVVLIPSYYASSLNKNLISEKLSTLKNTQASNIENVNASQVSIFNDQLSLIEGAQKDKYVISEKIINEIILKKMSDIKIESIFYEKDPSSNERKIMIRGTASSRERLLLFRKILEKDKLFKNVDLPISNFVKGSNISFSLNLMLS